MTKFDVRVRVNGDVKFHSSVFLLSQDVCSEIFDLGEIFWLFENCGNLTERNMENFAGIWKLCEENGRFWGALSKNYGKFFEKLSEKYWKLFGKKSVHLLS